VRRDPRRAGEHGHQCYGAGRDVRVAGRDVPDQERGAEAVTVDVISFAYYTGPFGGGVGYFVIAIVN
jgi:hypothetical protein